MSQIKLGARIMLGIPTLTTNRRSTFWEDGMAGLQMPLGSSMAREWTLDQPIDEARNAICKAALDAKCDYVFMLGDDVIPPPNTLLAMLDKIGRTHPVDGRAVRAEMITGVYWTKTYPPEPYLWRGLLKGSYKDWKVGEFFPVDFAGCDCLFFETEVLKKIPFPWFSTDWAWEPGQKPSSIATEDYYFYTKCREAGVRLFADTAIQCLHQDRDTGACFGIHMASVQIEGAEPADLPKGSGAVLVADIGAGLATHADVMGDNAKIVRFDMREDVKPDVRCDVRAIPEQWFASFDVVHASHVLEHFPRRAAPRVVRHWAHLLKVGGRLVVRVPNFERAVMVILDNEYLARKGARRDSASVQSYAWAQIYGDQAQEGAPWEHLNGFTAKKLEGLLKSVPEFANIVIEEEDEGQNLKGTAELVHEIRPYTLSEAWERIVERENGTRS